MTHEPGSETKARSIASETLSIVGPDRTPAEKARAVDRLSRDIIAAEDVVDSRSAPPAPTLRWGCRVVPRSLGWYDILSPSGEHWWGDFTKRWRPIWDRLAGGQFRTEESAMNTLNRILTPPPDYVAAQDAQVRPDPFDQQEARDITAATVIGGTVQIIGKTPPKPDPADTLRAACDRVLAAAEELRSAYADLKRLCKPFAALDKHERELPDDHNDSLRCMVDTVYDHAAAHTTGRQTCPECGAEAETVAADDRDEPPTNAETRCLGQVCGWREPTNEPGASPQELARAALETKGIRFQRST